MKGIVTYGYPQNPKAPSQTTSWQGGSVPELDSLIDQTLREIQELESQARQSSVSPLWNSGKRDAMEEGEIFQTQFSHVFFEETVSNLRTGHKEIQLMESYRVSSMKSSEHLLVDFDCLLERVDPTVRHWKMMVGSGSVVQRCMSLRKRFPSPCISAGKMSRAIIQVVISKTFCVIFFHESCGRRYSPILIRAHLFLNSAGWNHHLVLKCFHSTCYLLHFILQEEMWSKPAIRDLEVLQIGGRLDGSLEQKLLWWGFLHFR